MKAAESSEGAGPADAARAHAARVVGRNSQAREDVAAGAETTPPALVEWLLSGTFDRFEMVAHARIGAHHIFKTKFVGPTTVVVQARWVAEADGRWLVREAEVTRVEGGPVGALTRVSRPGEV